MIGKSLMTKHASNGEESEVGSELTTFWNLYLSQSLSPLCESPSFYGLACGMQEDNVLNDVIDRLLDVRTGRPGRSVNLSEQEVRQLAATAKDIFMSQPNLLELEAPIKICGKLSSSSRTFTFIRPLCISGLIKHGSHGSIGAYLHGRTSFAFRKLHHLHQLFMGLANHRCFMTWVCKKIIRELTSFSPLQVTYMVNTQTSLDSLSMADFLQRPIIFSLEIM